MIRDMEPGSTAAGDNASLMLRIPVSVCGSDPVIHAGITVMLRQHPDLELLDAPAECVVTVVVVCADVIDEQVLAAMRRWGADSSVRTVLVVGEIREARLLDAIGAGVVVVVRRREADAQVMAEAVRSAATGAGRLPADLLGDLLGQVRRAQAGSRGQDIAAMTHLSRREIEVVRLVAEGWETREIAAKISYSERTVKGVLHDIMLRFHLRNRAHVVAFAARQGYL